MISTSAAAVEGFQWNKYYCAARENSSKPMLTTIPVAKNWFIAAGTATTAAAEEMSHDDDVIVVT